MKSSNILFFRFLGWIVAILIMLFMFLSSAQNAEASSATSGGFIKIFLSLFYPEFNLSNNVVQAEIIKGLQYLFRKAAHFSSYFGLGFSLSVAIHTYDIKSICKFLLPVFISLIYAITDEIHQLFIPGRAGRISDVLLDLSGALLGTVIVLIIVFFYKKFKKRGL